VFASPKHFFSVLADIRFTGKTLFPGKAISSRTLTAIFLLLLPLLFQTSCSREANYLIPQLANSGPKPISTQNAYVAPNLLLATELANSKVVQNLTTQAGMPDAIEIERQGLQPYHLLFYYLNDKSYYDLQRHKSEWIVAGPERIAASKMKEVQAATKGKTAKQPALHDGGLNTLGDKAIASADDNETAPIVVDYNKRSTRIKSSGERSKRGSYVGDTSKQDVIHTVQYQGETMAALAKWYAEDESYIATLERINSIDADATLTIGQKITIPSYMVKQRKPLPEAVIKH